MAKAKDRQQSPFLGRDESWLSFNRRVLEEAQDDSNPLLERVKFLAITASNLDEFVEIRVASILQRIEDGYAEPTPDGMTLDQSLAAITDDIHDFVAEQGLCWNKQLQPALRAAGVRVLTWDEMGEPARKAATEFYQREVDPLLTPITIDPRHPFPRVLNKALCIALLLRSKRKSTTGPVLGVVTVPRALPRLVPLPSPSGTHDFIFLHDLIERHAAGMYRGYEILSKAAFRVTRNSNLYFQEEESRTLLETVRSELHNRRKGDAVRLEIEQAADPEIVDRLRINFELDESQVLSNRRPGEPFAGDEPLQRHAAAGFEIPALCPARAATEPQVDGPVRRASPSRHSAASSLRLLRRRGGIYSGGGEGPGRRLDEADAVPDQRRFAHLSGADRGRADQGSDGRRGADGALR